AAVGSDPKGVCGAMAGTLGCLAACDANGMCSYPDATTPCGTATCVDMITLQQANACDGKGNCVTQPIRNCTPYNCISNSCPTTCSSDADCVAPNRCTPGGGTCGEHHKLGESCNVNSDCENGKCVDKVCCASDCTGACQRCDVPPTPGSMPDGTCRSPVGQDPDNDCPGEGTCRGTCAVDRTCNYPASEQSCDVCKACNGQGKCNSFPKSGDDAACMIVACGALSNECRMYAD